MMTDKFYLLCVIFFFFQAEDGIRDWSVTGVQTCALPILTLPLLSQAGMVARHLRLKGERYRLHALINAAGATATGAEIGRASCRERGEDWGGAVYGRIKGTDYMR